ncbi:hypothetical protein ACX6XY_27585 [Streptomyces sp. O3]
MASGAPELVEAERVLLSLRHTHRDLWLGLREARGLAGAAAEWLRGGFSAGDLRQALSSGLPPGGVRSAVGFVRHRLAQKLPVPSAPGASASEGAAAPRGGLVVCAGSGAEHVFRPVGDETCCGRCRAREVRERWEAGTPAPPRPLTWRERVTAVAAEPSLD